MVVGVGPIGPMGHMGHTGHMGHMCHMGEPGHCAIQISLTVWTNHMWLEMVTNHFSTLNEILDAADL